MFKGINNEIDIASELECVSIDLGVTLELLAVVIDNYGNRTYPTKKALWKGFEGFLDLSRVAFEKLSSEINELKKLVNVAYGLD